MEPPNRPSGVAALQGKSALPLVVAGFALALYLVTMAPTVLWGDDAELQRIVVTGEARTIGQSSAASYLLWLALTRPFVQATAVVPLDPAGRTSLRLGAHGGAGAGVRLPGGTGAGASAGRRARLAGLLRAGALGVSLHVLAAGGAPGGLHPVRAAGGAGDVGDAVLAADVPAGVARRRGGGDGAGADESRAHGGVRPGLVALAVAVPRPQRRRLLPAVAGALALGAVALGAALVALGAPLVDLLPVAIAFRPAAPFAARAGVGAGVSGLPVPAVAAPGGVGARCACGERTGARWSGCCCSTPATCC